MQKSVTILLALLLPFGLGCERIPEPQVTPTPGARTVLCGDLGFAIQAITARLLSDTVTIDDTLIKHAVILSNTLSFGSRDIDHRFDDDDHLLDSLIHLKIVDHPSIQNRWQVSWGMGIYFPWLKLAWGGAGYPIDSYFEIVDCE